MASNFDHISAENLYQYLPQRLHKKLTKPLNKKSVQDIYWQLSDLRKRMSAYLPNYLSHMISERPVPGERSVQLNSGCLVFADVSGFTSMSEKLSALGKEGAEEITLIVNNFFEKMINIALEFGGDLIKFGGDALILFFTGDNSSLRAVVSAVTMQDSMEEFKQVLTSQGTSRLEMSIGIASGLVYMINMGTKEKMDYLLAGDTLERLDKAESIAEANQIAIDYKTYQEIKIFGIFSEVQPDYWILNQLDDSSSDTIMELCKINTGETPFEEVNVDREINILQALKPYIPSALFDHLVLDRSMDAYQGTHRPVSVLFAHFYGIENLILELGQEKPELILNVIDAYYCNMAQVIEQFGGVISRVDSYKSGQRILALFGALRAHENDHQLAVQTAWEMNKRLKLVNASIQEILKNETNLEINLGHRIGINSGFVFASDVGASFRREYTVMGDQVNLTARLMGVAEPGEILVGETTSVRLGANIILQEKPPIKVKGKANVVRRFTLVDIQEEIPTFTETTIPIFGRDVELAIGKDNIEHVKQGIFKPLVIQGISGIGKTRLSQELINFTRQNNFSILSSNAQSFSKTMPYHTWIKIFNQIFGMSSRDELGKEDRADKIKTGLKEIDSEEWAPLFGSIMGIDLPENQLTRLLDAKVRKQKIFNLTVQLLTERSKTSPIALFLDDVQWADPVSFELIQFLINNLPPSPILLLIVHRKDEGMPNWAEFSGVTEIDLHELPDYASIQLAKQMVGGIILPEQILEYILEKTSGSPLFIQEIMRELQENGVFSQDDLGSWSISEKLENIEIPGTIHELVLSRMDRLPIESRYLLQLASIIGADFSLTFLKGAFKLDQAELELKLRLEHLIEIGVIIATEPVTNTYKFHHLTTRDVVYNTLSYQDRRQMHNQCGQYLEDHTDFSGAERIDLMAFHFFEGRAWEKAVQFNLQAGKRAKSIFANESAIDAYQRVLEAASSGKNGKQFESEICTAKESLGDVFTLVGRYDDALNNFRFSLDNLCGDLDERELIHHSADLSRKIADVFERQSEHDDAFVWIDKGLKQISSGAPSIERAKLYLMGAGLHHRKGDNEQATSWCDLSIADSELLSSDEAVQAKAQAFYLRGAIELRNGNLIGAVEFCGKSKELYKEINDVVGEARAWNNMGIALTDMGEWDQATHAIEYSLRINQQIGNVHEEGFGANNLGNIYLYKGEWKKALKLFRQSNLIWKRIGAVLPDAVTLSNQAQAHIYLENWDEAEDLLEEAERKFSKVGSDDFTPELERRWGELRFKTGEINAAKSHLTKSLNAAVEHNAQLEAAMTQRILGEVLLQQGETETSKAILEESLRILVEIKSDYESAQTCVSLARLRIHQGNFEEAKDHLWTAIRTFQKSGAAFDLKVAKNLLNKLHK